MNNLKVSLAQDFIWKNARLIDRTIFTCLFTNGGRQSIFAALQAYQNPDGGFGNALEPDKRCPQSQPVDIERAFRILDHTGMLEDPRICDRVYKELILPACDFLDSITTGEGGVPFALPSVNQYPHAPWWSTGENPPADLNPTAAIVGLLMKFGIQHPWHERSIPYCWKAIEESDSEQYHTLMPVITFLENVPDRARANHELERLATRIIQRGLVEMDPEAGGYVKKPLDWAPTPNSFCRKLFDSSTISCHLDALARRQRSDGGWPINWDPISPAVELEWRGWLTIEALTTLIAYQAI